MTDREPYGASEEFPAQIPGQGELGELLPEYTEPMPEGMTGDTPESLGIEEDEPGGNWAGADALDPEHHPHDGRNPAPLSEQEPEEIGGA